MRQNNHVRKTLLALLVAAPAHAVTITEVAGPGGGAPVEADPAAFQGFGACGSGGSVVNDGCSVAVKDASSPGLAGRFDPFGGSWIDSQDRPTIVWTIEQARPFASVRFALTDAFDQPEEARWGGASFFALTSGDASWSIAEREADGTLHWIEVLLDAPTTRAELTAIAAAPMSSTIATSSMRYAPSLWRCPVSSIATSSFPATPTAGFTTSPWPRCRRRPPAASSSTPSRSLTTAAARPTSPR